MINALLARLLLPLALITTSTIALPVDADTPALGTFITGGIGSDAREEFARRAGDYNLQLRFAAVRSGAYLADVTVRIDGLGESAFTEVCRQCGPLFYARLAPGAYRLTLSRLGEPDKILTVKLHPAPQSHVTYWTVLEE